MSIEYDISKRWEDGTPHHPRSVELFKRLADLDFKHVGDYFCWKSGGDGDNGETLMYELDILFEEDDQVAKAFDQAVAKLKGLRGQGADGQVGCRVWREPADGAARRKSWDFSPCE